MRLWLQRIGLAQLRSPLPAADDWVWFVDCSIQIGSQRVLVVVAVRASCISWGCSLCHEDLNLVALEVLHQAKKEDIFRCLQQQCQKGVVPTAILSDHGADILAAIKLLQANYPKTRDLYDIKHKTACLLKAAMESDPQWTRFQHELGQSKFRSQQTIFGYASAPSQRSKAKYMNLNKVVRWATGILWHLRDQSRLGIATKGEIEKRKKFQELFGWVERYRSSTERWKQMLEVVEITLDLTRREGLSHETVGRLEGRLSVYDQGVPLVSSLKEFIQSQSSTLRAQERLPISTEVLESLFSRLKNAERTQEKSGFTSMVLSLGAMIGRRTPEEIREALRTTPISAVYTWAKESIGTTVQAARTAFFKAIQKRNRNRQTQTAIE